MTASRPPRTWWYCLTLAALAAFSWAIAVAAFAGRFSALRMHSSQSDVLTIAGWGLGLYAIILLADLLGQTPSSHLPPDA